MKKIILCAAALTVLGAAAYASTITVLVQQTALRKRPQSYSPSVGTARLGQKFESEGLEAGFHKTGSGYIHSSAVTTRKASLSGGAGVGGSATADEVTVDVTMPELKMAPVGERAKLVLVPDWTAINPVRADWTKRWNREVER